jgi:hypothetical protein
MNTLFGCLAITSHQSQQVRSPYDLVEEVAAPIPETTRTAAVKKQPQEIQKQQYLTQPESKGDACPKISESHDRHDPLHAEATAAHRAVAHGPSPTFNDSGPEDVGYDPAGTVLQLK